MKTEKARSNSKKGGNSNINQVEEEKAVISSKVKLAV